MSRYSIFQPDDDRELDLEIHTEPQHFVIRRLGHQAVLGKLADGVWSMTQYGDFYEAHAYRTADPLMAALRFILENVKE